MKTEFIDRTLEGIRARISQRENPFSCLEAYWEGYWDGYNAGQHGFMSPEQFTPREFSLYVMQHFGCKHQNEKSWRQFIREHTNSEREAFDLFFELRLDYEKRQKPAA